MTLVNQVVALALVQRIFLVKGPLMKNYTISLLGLALVAVITSGCANGSRGYGAPKQIIIDTKGVDMNAYYDDLGDCEHYARHVDVSAETTEGAVAGAVLGGVLGAVVGNHKTAERSAGAGAIVGGVKGNQRARHEQERIVRRCLSGRGYRVLN
jgi:outer membrane lipoprotein SlyB